MGLREQNKQKNIRIVKERDGERTIFYADGSCIIYDGSIEWECSNTDDFLEQSLEFKEYKNILEYLITYNEKYSEEVLNLALKEVRKQINQYKNDGEPLLTIILNNVELETDLKQKLRVEIEKCRVKEVEQGSFLR